MRCWSIQAEEIGFNRYTILNLHAILSDNLLGDPQAGGRLRKIPVGIAGTSFLPLNVPQLIEECFDLVSLKADSISDPFEQALFVMVHLPYLQPFEDVNKRVSRLAANIPMIRRNLCPLSFVDVPESDYIEGTLAVYELNPVELLRDVFISAYERSCARYAAVRQQLGQPDPFRIRHRQLLAQIIGSVIKGAMNSKKATQFIQSEANRRVDEPDRKRFIEMVETELMGLHEGNFAKYQLCCGIRELAPFLAVRGSGFNHFHSTRTGSLDLAIAVFAADPPLTPISSTPADPQ